MAPIKKLRQERAAMEIFRHPLDTMRTRLFSGLTIVLGPLFLVYLNVRCQKNQCVLFQLPLVFPTHLGAYFSVFSICSVLFFIMLMFLFTLSSRGKGRRYHVSGDGTSLSPGLSSLMSTSMLLISIAYLKPEYIKVAHSEYLRLLASTILFCFGFSFVVFLLVHMKSISKEKDLSRLTGFFYGYTTKLRIAQVDLKYFFYINTGMVAWALLDLLIFINYVLDRVSTAPLAFLCTTQLIMIVHTLLYEKFLGDRPFMYTEGFGFFWMLRVMMFMPFFFSLPVMYVASTEISIPKPAMLADCVLFLLGFVIYVSSIHQKENFVANPSAYRNLKSIPSYPGRRLLMSGYWGIVQKPDYLGYAIIWLSWAIACGFSAISVIVLFIVYINILVWLHKVTEFNKSRFGTAWNRYTSVVPYRIIPLIY